jgi:hypothetical protein
MQNILGLENLRQSIGKIKHEFNPAPIAYSSFANARAKAAPDPDRRQPMITVSHNL